LGQNMMKNELRMICFDYALIQNGSDRSRSSKEHSFF
jgi:hypothetical protein